MFNPLPTILVTVITLSTIVHAHYPGADPADPADSTEKEEKVTVAIVGEEAPLFELKDQYGKMHKLADYKGKIVVLEWFNETCPFCKGVWDSGLVPNLIKELNSKETDVVYLAMNSTANQPEEKIREGSTEFLEELEVETPMLMDYDGTVGHLYEARTTPHMFVIDTEGVLVYQGALSDDARSKKGDKAETHILRVITQLEAGEEVSPTHIKPWGCSVKYSQDGDAGRRGPRGGRPRR